ncbi:MAG: lytic transglycosylase domain-containing protein [Burkholderiaceae bacterium]
MLSPAARADVYGYVDAQGMAHFSTVKLDSRYRLFLRGGDKAFDAADLMTPGKLTRPPPAPASPLVQTLSQHPNLKKYEALLEQAAKEFDLEPALLKAVMAAESGFNPGAVSPKGAVGLMQVLPATAERYGLQADKKKSLAQKLADPKTNIRLAARYLRDLHRLFPERPDLVLASYNAGEGAVQKYDNKVPPYPETRNYVKLVTEFYQLYRPMEAPHIRRVRMTLPPQPLPLPELTAAAEPTPLPDSFAD